MCRAVAALSPVSMTTRRFIRFKLSTAARLSGFRESATMMTPGRASAPAHIQRGRALPHELPQAAFILLPGNSLILHESGIAHRIRHPIHRSGNAAARNHG